MRGVVFSTVLLTRHVELHRARTQSAPIKKSDNNSGLPPGRSSSVLCFFHQPGVDLFFIHETPKCRHIVEIAPQIQKK